MLDWSAKKEMNAAEIQGSRKGLHNHVLMSHGFSGRGNGSHFTVTLHITRLTRAIIQQEQNAEPVLQNKRHGINIVR